MRGKKDGFQGEAQVCEKRRVDVGGGGGGGGLVGVRVAVDVSESERGGVRERDVGEGCTRSAE